MIYPKNARPLLPYFISQVLRSMLKCHQFRLGQRNRRSGEKAEILILDDIGAEQMSAWVRDEILQVILQHRMQENLPTFFTSNFNFEELERHFATSRNGDETWQAKRVMERVKFLAKEIHLEGVNRR